MIRHELQTTVLRFYGQQSDDPFAPYDAICTLFWETPETIWIIGMHGTVTRKLFRELVNFCVEQKVLLVKAHRDPNRRLPFGRVVDDHVEILVADAANRIK